GLRDDAHADATAAALASAPVVSMLDTLDLSMGTLGDEGAKALMKNPALRKLKHLILRHHYLSDEMMERLRKLGPKVDVDDKQTPADGGDGELHRYVEVFE